MTKYATYDAGVDPRPVTGWFDTDVHDYDADPPDPKVVVPDATWDDHFAPGPWEVIGGVTLQRATEWPNSFTPTTTRGSAPAAADRPDVTTIAIKSGSMSFSRADHHALREAARDAAARLGLPGGGTSWVWCGLTLDGRQTIALYKDIRDGKTETKVV